ncbi:MAG: toxin-activating lysine-acyltransferase [Rhodospirillaceae bacterium]|jgi:cytolysin-activating lysine-acyltransferase|nr:toxin-activating lysine-acyltransferase [Rhodospirillaceae bacterium]MBT5079547.1 toxin-activating lysine-acyltransferase [Rhodospirillaceae bacterium]MBT5527303.1 toxin-activating lysine-acyltransferase [Rhodospirillaceae bacterium]MBT5879378.1 toxin-activating lysine-acyltransferase [Rhodospirillaceae bacterium]MBT6589069.1 toxin-activating lysine-acyltransferase [Rhodospirillaceae bacterium]
MMRSAPHRHLFVGDLEWLLMPPIACKQFRLWRRENMPVAFASWALLSDEVEARLIESIGATVGGLDAAPAPEVAAEAADDAPSSEPQPAFAAPRLRLAPGDWQSGKNLWLIDMVCPFGGSGEAAKQLREQTFKGRAVKTVRAKADGTGFEVGAWVA